MKRCFWKIGSLMVVLALIVTACGEAEDDGGGGGQDPGASVTVSQTTVFTGSIRVESLVETAMYGSGQSSSAGASPLGAITVVLQPNGTMTIQYTSFAFDEDFFSTGAVYEPSHYTPENNTTQTAAGVYSYGAFSFNDGHGHWTGTFNADLLSGTCTWTEVKPEHDGDVRVVMQMSFQAVR